MFVQRHAQRYSASRGAEIASSSCYQRNFFSWQICPTEQDVQQARIGLMKRESAGVFAASAAADF
jgi:hypothetical protein